MKLWQRRVAQWLTPGEAGLFLLESLTGQAELETEHVSIDRAAQPDGVDYLLSTLRNPLGEKSLYLKRLYLQEWENIGRQQNESVRSYLNRFRRVMLDLQSQEVGLESAFSSESVGFRLLERCRLAPDQQRVVLVGSNQMLPVRVHQGEHVVAISRRKGTSSLVWSTQPATPTDEPTGEHQRW